MTFLLHWHEGKLREMRGIVGIRLESSRKRSRVSSSPTGRA
jgi:hypothetical protein